MKRFVLTLLGVAFYLSFAGLAAVGPKALADAFSVDAVAPPPGIPTPETGRPR